MKACCKLLSGALLLLLAGCPLRPAPPAPSAATAATAATTAATATAVSGLAAPSGSLGTPYEVSAPDSLLTILVYRAGPLASAGHNHVIASHDLGGTVYLPADPLRSSFELRIPVATLTVDEAALRAQQGGRDFPPDVSDAAKSGTRRNMLGEALLDAAHHPQIVLRTLTLERAPAAGGDGTGPRGVTAHVESTVRGRVRAFDVPVRCQLAGGTLTLAGEVALRQSQLGLTPFSALLGALQVQDEMRVAFRIVARAGAAAATSGAAPPAAPPPDTPCAAPPT